MNSVMVKFVVLGGIMNSFLGNIYIIFLWNIINFEAP
jgi:hypothetical protein